MTPRSDEQDRRDSPSCRKEDCKDSYDSQRADSLNGQEKSDGELAERQAAHHSVH